MKTAFLSKTLSVRNLETSCATSQHALLVSLLVRALQKTITFLLPCYSAFNLLHFFFSCAAFYRGWDMAFVIVATLPFLVGVGMAISVVTGRLSVRYFCVYLLSILSQQRNRVLLMNFLFTAVFLFLLSRSWYPRPISNLMRSLRKH